MKITVTENMEEGTPFREIKPGEVFKAKSLDKNKEGGRWKYYLKRANTTSAINVESGMSRGFMSGEHVWPVDAEMVIQDAK